MTNETQLRAWLEAARDCLRAAKGIARATDAVLVEQAQDFIGKTLAALESEPLAVVEGWIAEEDIKPFDGLFQIWARDALLHTEGHIPVTVTITRKPNA